MEPEHFQSLARYNQWANQRLYGACRALPEEAYHDRREAAFFGSIHGTLNHILLGDRVWFDRVEGERTEGISSLDQILYRDFTSLAHARAFQEELLDRGLLATLRISKGQDILAACGQLSTETKSRRAAG